MNEDLKSRLLAFDHGDGGSQWPRNPDGAEAVKEIERLEEACTEWSQVSQRNYQRAKKAEDEVVRLRKAFGECLCETTSKATPTTVGGREYRESLISYSAIRDAREALKGGGDE